MRGVAAAPEADMTDIREFDLHVHVGDERGPNPLSAFVEGLAARGVRYVGLCDHVEIYVPNKGPWAVDHHRHLVEKGWQWYTGDLGGLKALYADIDAIGADDNGLSTRKGLEIGNIDNTPDGFLELPDFLSHCFGRLKEELGETWADRAASRIRRFGRKVAGTGKPGVINHPFRYRLGEYRRQIEAGAPPRPDEILNAETIHRMADAAREFGLFLEVNMRTIRGAAREPRALDLLARCVKWLVESGAPLSFGSDFHKPPEAEFDPAVERVLRESDLGFEHINALVRRLGFDLG